MTIDANLEIRKLPPSHISQLSSILEYADQWKKLMAIVPTKLVKENFVCLISCENPPKYNSDHIRVIETASQKYKRPGTEILLDEWGCSGRIRPAVGHLLYLLIKAELFRAADYVAVQILHAKPPQRPSQGPAAPVNTNLNGHIIGEILDGMDYDSSLIENILSSEPDANLDNSIKRVSIPAIIVTPDADNDMSPNFELNTNESNSSNISSLIQFSPITSTSSLPNLPIFSDGDSDSQSVTTASIPNSTESIQDLPNISILNYESSDKVPNLSILDQSSVPNSNVSSSSIQTDILPNLSGLHQPEIAIPNFMELLHQNGADSDNNNTEENLGLPKLSVLIENSIRSSLNVSTVSSKSRSCTSPLPNLTLKTHLPHFAYEEIEAATNDFNEEPFETLDKRGRFLGEGAFGKVFLATGLLNRPVAVKKIILENVEVVNIDDAVTKQFKNEVEVLSRFKHENLLSILGYSCDGCTYCLVYEYISGGTLKDRLQDAGKLLWEERLPIALGTAKAISYLHTAFSSPLIHRDIKTANILLDSSNKPKLGDFGITKLLNNPNTNTCTVIGTSAYMAPEALRGDISVKCDTFSFGVVLLELLTSLPTFDENRDGNDLVTHVEETCEDSIEPLLDTKIGSWIKNDVNFGEKIYALAVQCLEEKKRRPEMVQVTKMLEEICDKL